MDLQSEQKSQTYFLHHTDDISCIDSIQDTFITSQVGQNPLICVWQYNENAPPGEQITLRASFTNVIEGGAAKICLSPDGKKFAIASLGKPQTLVVQEIDREPLGSKPDPKKNIAQDYLLISGLTIPEPIFDLRFDISNAANQSNQLVVACLNKIYFISMDKGAIRKKEGIWPDKIIPVALLSTAFVETKLVTGTFRGEIIQWEKDRGSKVISAFEQSPVLGNKK